MYVDYCWTYNKAVCKEGWDRMREEWDRMREELL